MMRKNQHCNKIDRILKMLGIFVVAFVVVMIVTFWVKGSVPDTLIVAVLGSGGLEALFCAAIKIANILKGRNQEE